jgi:hypothetical protein
MLNGIRIPALPGVSIRGRGHPDRRPFLLPRLPPEHSRRRGVPAPARSRRVVVSFDDDRRHPRSGYFAADPRSCRSGPLENARARAVHLLRRERVTERIAALEIAAGLSHRTDADSAAVYFFGSAFAFPFSSRMSSSESSVIRRMISSLLCRSLSISPRSSRPVVGNPFCDRFLRSDERRSAIQRPRANQLPPFGEIRESASKRVPSVLPRTVRLARDA